MKSKSKLLLKVVNRFHMKSKSKLVLKTLGKFIIGLL